jgi:hypothetical protein
MCGRFTRNYTWEQIQALYRLTAPAVIPNLQPRFHALASCSELNVNVEVGCPNSVEGTQYHRCPKVSLLSWSAYMSANAIYFAFGLAAGFALFGALLGTIWKRL